MEVNFRKKSEVHILVLYYDADVITDASDKTTINHLLSAFLYSSFYVYRYIHIINIYVIKLS